VLPESSSIPVPLSNAPTGWRKGDAAMFLYRVPIVS
jgi:hypothetical protein